MKHKFSPGEIWQVDKNFNPKETWLKVRIAPSDQKCKNCSKLFIDDEHTHIGFATIKGKPNIPICSTCAQLFIDAGAIDIAKQRNEIKLRKENLILSILEIPDHFYKRGHTSTWNKSNDLDLYKEDELQQIYDKLKLKYDESLRIQEEIKNKWKDIPLEQYLIDDYNVFEDKQYLQHPAKIERYFKDNGFEYFDCGQGYYQEEVDLIIKISDKFYTVIISAEINSSKQDRGDRLYWVESISSVAYEEISKPLPKEKQNYTYIFNLSVEQKSYLDNFLNENKYLNIS